MEVGGGWISELRNAGTACEFADALQRHTKSCYSKLEAALLCTTWRYGSRTMNVRCITSLKQETTTVRLTIYLLLDGRPATLPTGFCYLSQFLQKMKVYNIPQPLSFKIFSVPTRYEASVRLLIPYVWNWVKNSVPRYCGLNEAFVSAPHDRLLWSIGGIITSTEAPNCSEKTMPYC